MFGRFRQQGRSPEVLDRLDVARREVRLRNREVVQRQLSAIFERLRFGVFLVVLELRFADPLRIGNQPPIGHGHYAGLSAFLAEPFPSKLR